MATALPEDIFAACSVGTVLLAAGVGGVNFHRSTDGGANWTQVDTPTDEMYGLSRGPADDLVAVAVGENGRIWRTPDAGLTWAEQTSPTTVVLHAVTRATAALVAVGDSGKVIRSTNNGTTWTLIAAGITAHLYGVGGWLLVFVAVGAGGQIWRSSNSGANWTQITSPVTSALRAVARSGTGRWTAAGDDGVILQSLDDGLTWKVQESPTTNDLLAVVAHFPSGRAIAGGLTTTIVTE